MVLMTHDTITASQGFLAAGVRCGIKKSGKPDLGLIVCPQGATAAAVFTTNQITSAAVEVSRRHIHARKVFAVVVNSGNANACTGKRGVASAIRTCRHCAGALGVEPGQVLVASTGIIGEHLPVDKVTSGLDAAVQRLSSSAQSGLDFATAIMTTDTRPKQAVRRIDLSGVRVTLAGTTKGAGMIGPNMATTLCFLTTDAVIGKPLLDKALREAIGQSLNKLTVDGHQSTNDTAILLASGQAGHRPITSGGRDYARFVSSLTEVCDDLARQMALDAEGATRMFKVLVRSAASRTDAVKAARAVADYPLVKCAVHGGDPNWGRIICAVGSTNVKLNPKRLSCRLDDLMVFKNGAPCAFDRKRASRIILQAFHTITVDLGAGKASDFCYGVDLGREYVTINADYHT
jgi:glutamate N-acetyltransferase / amino-acid N-acetyltransferase